MKRIFLIVLDSVGAGAAPDAAAFGDAGVHTLRSVQETGLLRIPNLQKAGIGVAMGNAATRLKEVADDVCAPVSEDGIYHYCVEHGLI